MTVKRIVVLVAVALAFFTVVGAAGGGMPQIDIGQPSEPQSPEPTEVAQGEGGTQEQPATEAPAENTPTPRPSPVDPAAIASGQQAIILLNPATVMAGASVNVNGSGFVPGSTVDVYVQEDKDDKGESVGFVQADKGGNFSGFSFTLPPDYAGRRFLVVARQHDGKREATAQGNAAANSPVIKFGTQVGKPGDMVTFSARGFVPEEKLEVYFNSLSGKPVTTLQADKSGGIRQDSIKVPFGAVGDNSFIFVGENSRSPVTVPFLLLNFYPSVAVSDYAAKADTTLTFTGDGFGPHERVSVHLNNPMAPPVAVFETDDEGAFADAGSFLIPFGMEGENTFVFVGEQSQAASSVAFEVQPYTPFAEPSTYGGRPGTTVTFYGAGFARNEVVRVFVGATHDSAGKEVACFKADDRGDVRGGGSYTVPPNAQAGTLGFRLVGDKSGGAADASIEVMDGGGPMQGAATPPEQGYTCQFDVEQSEQPEAESQAEGNAEQPQSGGAATPQAQGGGTATPQAQGGQTQPRPSPGQSPTATKPKPEPTPTARPSPTRGGG